MSPRRDASKAASPRSPLSCEAVACAALGQPAGRKGCELLFRCPWKANHRHGDADPSLAINPGKNVWLCGPCNQSGTAWQLAAFLGGLDPGDTPGIAAWLHDHGLIAGARRRRTPPCTVEALAMDKKLPAEFLASLGVRNREEGGVVIEYRLEDGSLAPRQRIRTALCARDGSRWSNGPGELVPYGLWRLPDLGESQTLVLVEGESDSWTLWWYGYAALGLPGSNTANLLQAKHVAGIQKIFVMQDGDLAGQNFAAAVVGRLHKIGWRGEAFIVPFNDKAKDPAALHQADRGAFRERFAAMLRDANTAGPSSPEGSRPGILLAPGKLPEAIDQAEGILVSHAARLGVFQRGGELVRMITLPDKRTGGGLSRPAGTAQLEPLSTVALTEIFDRLASWQRITADGQRRNVDCPGRIATAYRSRVGAWNVPLLAGIISAPILRRDGSVLAEPGYDPATGLYLVSDGSWPLIPDNPTPEDGQDSLQKLQAPFLEFPWAAPADRSVFAAAILTALQRRLLESAPLFGFTAPTQRTGKSLLAGAMAIIATGKPAPAMAVSREGEELRKSVSAILREGHAIVNLDNVEHPLASPDLARAITQAEYADRVLGETRLLRLPTNIVWIVTGNNLALRGDLSARALLCTIDAGLERPEERTFRIPDLKAYITEHRRELVTAALTILRAYNVAGKPRQGLKPWGGFDHWSAEIREPLVWLGLADPCETRATVIENDPDHEAAAAVLSAWHRVMGDFPVTLREVLQTVESSEELHESLLAVSARATDHRVVDPRKLGWWCRKWERRVVRRLQLQREGSEHRAIRWRVAEVPSRGPAGSRGDPRPLGAVSHTSYGELFPAEKIPIPPSATSGIVENDSHRRSNDSPDSPDSPRLARSRRPARGGSRIEEGEF